MKPTPDGSSATPLEFAAFFACTLPFLLAYSLSPMVTLFNQVAAVAGWGLFLLVSSTGGLPRGAGRPSSRSASAALLVVLAACGLAAWLSGELDGNAPGLARQSTALVACAVGVVVLGLRCSSPSASVSVSRALADALVVAGGLSLLLAAVQVFAPELADGMLVARPVREGRAVGNLRQPNHLSTLLQMAAAAWVWRSAARREGPAWHSAWVGIGLWALTWGVVVTGSRTGMVGIVLLALWGVLGRSLPRHLRGSLLSLPLAYGVWWALMAAWAHWSGHAFIGETRLAAGGDISSSRFKIWADTLELIRQHPWWGVGWGNFNFAWTLTAFPGRPVAFFDHSHNLVLQWLLEFGIPLGVLMLLLLAWAYWGLVRQARRAGAASVPAMALYIVTLALIHSLLEYPLWYAYFLLPVACIWALGLAAPVADAPARAEAAGLPSPLLMLAGTVIVVGAAYALLDYRRVTEIYSPSPRNSASLPERIAIGQRSFFFAYQADYAAATTADPKDEAGYAALRGATHNLLDTRLMMAWAEAEAARGHLNRARYLAHRLREFHNDMSADYFVPCEPVGGEDEAPASASARSVESLPYQCQDDVALKWTDFR